MQLKRWLSVALAAGLLHAASPILVLSSSAAAATTTALTLGVGVANPALALVGGAAVLLGAAGLVAAKAKAASRRGRRAAPALAHDAYAQNALHVLFAAAGSLDQRSNCGLRLVCELSATPEAQLAADEALIMALFGSPALAAHDRASGPASPFQLAAFLGRASESASACARTYAKCPYDAAHTMDVLRQNALSHL